MKILVDADSCPKEARELTQRRAAALGIRAVFAANRRLPGIDDELMEVCPNGENSADNRIVELAEAGDIAISRDVPLAKRLVERNVTVIDDRGRVFTGENINELLSLRNFMVDLAESGLGIERKKSYGRKELKTYADSLDRVLNSRRHCANSRTPR
ncbi:MAG: DUF188 domain-containing protein [Treponema sp.]|nr:DUF188 domain-containing protein [Treponema sp.]